MRNFYFGLDLGHYEIKFTVLEETYDGRLISYNTSLKNEYFRKNDIIEQENLISLINNILENTLETFEIKKIEKLNISLTLPSFQKHIQKGHAIFEDNVKEEDIKKTIRTAKNFLLLNNQEVLIEEPLKFLIDGIQEVRDPLGFAGKRLDADVLFITCFRSFYEKIKNIFKELNLEIDNIFPSVYSSSKVCLSKKDKEMGVGLIDIGGETTSIGIFNEGKLVDMAVFDFGSEILYQDLALYLKVDLEEIEKIKSELHKPAAVTSKKINKKEEKLRQQIFKFFEKKLREYFEELKVKDYIKNIKKEYKLPAGLVMIGGFSLYENSLNLLKNILEISIKFPKDELNIFENEYELRKFSSSAGAALMLRDLSKEYGLLEKIKKFFYSFWSR
ncbi:MAG: cell division FtsA domain-containing protein [Minisyncoccia bacterium]|jgi:cell division protein FtsA